MHELRKIAEAQFFLEAMRLEPDRARFEYYLSAFLSAARSALQYAREEAQHWHDQSVAHAVPTHRFFKETRDMQIYSRPATPSADISVAASDQIVLREECSFTVRRADGTLKQASSLATTSVPQECARDHEGDPLSMGPEYRLVFRDWPGPESVVELCERHLREVSAFVDDGRREGHLS